MTTPKRWILSFIFTILNLNSMHLFHLQVRTSAFLKVMFSLFSSISKLVQVHTAYINIIKPNYEVDTRSSWRLGSQIRDVIDENHFHSLYVQYED